MRPRAEYSAARRSTLKPHSTAPHLEAQHAVVFVDGRHLQRFVGVKIEPFLWRVTRDVRQPETRGDEERPVLVFADETQRMARDQILSVADVLRAILAVVPPAHRTASLHGATSEVIRAATIIDPSFIEAVRVRSVTSLQSLVRQVLEGFGERGAKLRSVGIIAIVPLAADERRVARAAKGFRPETSCPSPCR